MSLKLNKKEFLDGHLGLVDHITQQPIEATFENETFTSDDESIATASQPQDDVVEVTGVAVGKANLTVEADATYTDPHTKSITTKHKSVVIEVEITESEDEAETDLVVNFGTVNPVS